jgi:hypothetical protein
VGLGRAVRERDGEGDDLGVELAALRGGDGALVGLVAEASRSSLVKPCFLAIISAPANWLNWMSG